MEETGTLDGKPDSWQNTYKGSSASVDAGSSNEMRLSGKNRETAARPALLTERNLNALLRGTMGSVSLWAFALPWLAAAMVLHLRCSGSTRVLQLTPELCARPSHLGDAARFEAAACMPGEGDASKCTIKGWNLHLVI
jgi:hypothetical protein